MRGSHGTLKFGAVPAVSRALLICPVAYENHFGCRAVGFPSQPHTGTTNYSHSAPTSGCQPERGTDVEIHEGVGWVQQACKLTKSYERLPSVQMQSFSCLL